MAGPFFGGSFFDGGFFAPLPVKTGGKGDNDARRRNIVKPLGVLHLPPVKARPSVRERASDSAGIAAEVADRLAREFKEDTALVTARPIAQMSLAEVDAEIGALIRKKLRNEEDELMLLILMAAAE